MTGLIWLSLGVSSAQLLPSNPFASTSPTVTPYFTASNTVTPSISPSNVPVPPACPSCPNYPISYTGDYQYFQVPANVSQLEVHLWGGGGYADVDTAGTGAYIAGVLSVTPKEVLRFIIGSSSGSSNYLDQTGGGGCVGGSSCGGGRTAIQRWSAVDGRFNEIVTAGGGAGDFFDPGCPASWTGNATASPSLIAVGITGAGWQSGDSSFPGCSSPNIPTGGPGGGTSNIASLCRARGMQGEVGNGQGPMGPALYQPNWNPGSSSTPGYAVVVTLNEPVSCAPSPSSTPFPTGSTTASATISTTSTSSPTVSVTTTPSTTTSAASTSSPTVSVMTTPSTTTSATPTSSVSASNLPPSSPSQVPVACFNCSATTMYANGQYQFFIVPYGISLLEVHAWGAGGSSFRHLTGGTGVYLAGLLPIQPMQVIRLIVGTSGGSYADASGGAGCANQPEAVSCGGGRTALQVLDFASGTYEELFTAAGGGGAAATLNASGGAAYCMSVNGTASPIATSNNGAGYRTGHTCSWCAGLGGLSRNGGLARGRCTAGTPRTGIGPQGARAYQPSWAPGSQDTNGFMTIVSLPGADGADAVRRYTTPASRTRAVRPVHVCGIGASEASLLLGSPAALNALRQSFADSVAPSLGMPPHDTPVHIAGWSVVDVDSPCGGPSLMVDMALGTGAGSLTPEVALAAASVPFDMPAAALRTIHDAVNPPPHVQLSLIALPPRLEHAAAPQNAANPTANPSHAAVLVTAGVAAGLVAVVALAMYIRASRRNRTATSDASTPLLDIVA